MVDPGTFSKRERQIMDVVFALGQATVNAVHERLPDPPTKMAVRRTMHILVEKGHLKRKEAGREVVYAPNAPRKRAGLDALENVLTTFFHGSLEEALTAHFVKGTISRDEKERLLELIERARLRQREEGER